METKLLRWRADLTRLAHVRDNVMITFVHGLVSHQMMNGDNVCGKLRSDGTAIGYVLTETQLQKERDL